MGHGTAVVRHHDGSYQNIAQIDGDDGYVDMMIWLAFTMHPRIPYGGYQDNWAWHKADLSRHANKLLGKPATNITKVLAKMVQNLHQEVEKQLDIKIHSVAISAPDQVNLLKEELNDMLDFLHLQNAMYEKDSRYNNLYAYGAAYAGVGQGLCDDYIDAYACEREEHRLPHRHVLQLEYSSTSLGGAIWGMRLPYYSIAGITATNTSLGMDNLERLVANDTVGIDQYWWAVRKHIAGLVQSYPQLPTYLILTGTSASNNTFKEVVQDALRDSVSRNAISMLDMLESQADDKFNPVWLTARGAAELAKRRQEGCFRCTDTPECQLRRRAAAHKPKDARQSVLGRD